MAPGTSENKFPKASSAEAPVPNPSAIELAVHPGESPQAKVLPFIYFHLLFFGATWLDIGLIITGAVSAAASGVPFPLMAILFGQLVNDLNGATCEAGRAGNAQSYVSTINEKLLLLVCISIGAFILTFVYCVSWNLVSQRLAQRLRERYFKSLLRKEQAFFDQCHAGEVSSRLNGDVQAIQSGTCEKVGIFIASISFFIAAYAVAFTRETKLASILISIVPAFLLAAMAGGAFIQKFSGRMSEAIASASSITSEALSHIAIVDAFRAGPRLEVKFAEEMLVARSEGIRKGVVAATQAGLLYFIAYSANALAFWEGSRMIAKTIAGNGNGVTVGEIYTVVFIVVDACVILGSAAPLLPLFGGASAAFQRLISDIDHMAAIDGTSDAGQVLPSDTPGVIEFRNVSFAYPSRPNEYVLRNVTVNFPAGKHTAIVGRSGSGKSTIAGLISRLYDPIEGNIFFDDQSLRDLNPRNLRSFISLVHQEPSLLDRSILENIALGLINSPQAIHKNLEEALLGPQLAENTAEIGVLPPVMKVQDPVMAKIFELVRKSAELADAGEFINLLEKGYGTAVGQNGKSVSGGQRQRIALARALIRDPKVLILDEATASLDSASEQRIQAAIDNVTTNKTVISITHRLSTIKNADNIVVLDAGEIVEQGTYAQLMAYNGIFAGMVSLQVPGSEEQTSPESESKNRKDDLEIFSQITKANGGEACLSSDKSSPDSENALNKTKADESTDSRSECGQNSWVVIRGMSYFIRPMLPWLVAAIFAATIVGLTFSASGLIFGHTVGALSNCNTNAERIIYLGQFFGGMLFMLAVVELFANFVSWSSFGVVAERLLFSVRILTFRSLFEQTVEWHQTGSRDPSMLLSIITKDTAALGGFSGSIFGTIFSILVNFLAAIILSHVIAWKIAIVCLTMVPILLGSGIMQLRTLSRYEERNLEASAKCLGIAVESVNSIKTIAILSLEHEVMGTYRRALKYTRKKMFVASVYTNFWLAVSNSTGFFIYAFAYWWGSQLITKGENTQQQFFIVLVAMLVSAQLWGQMFTLAPEVSRSRSAASRILNLINAGSTKQQYPTFREAKSPSHSTEKDVEALANSELSRGMNLGARVSFNNVAFSYSSRPGVPVLLDVSFSIQPGQFCCLVGPSGAGKSTIFALTQRVYAPTEGTVKIDGVDVSHRDFRDEIAVVPQDNALFNGTIKFNVSLGARPGQDATDEEIEEACRLSNIHDTIMALPQQYDTPCGPNGSQLSGGQRQRLTIARALVRKPRLLLLDESTNALDAETESALQEGLDRLHQNSAITIIAITHRLRTALKADATFVVDGGKIVDSGKHEQLLAKSESYRNNARQQMLYGAVSG